MSTILRALKKAEQASGNGRNTDEPDLRTGFEPQDDAKAHQPATKSAISLIRLVSAGLIGLCLIVVGGYLFWFRAAPAPFVTSPEPTAVPEQKTVTGQPPVPEPARAGASDLPGNRPEPRKSVSPPGEGLGTPAQKHTSELTPVSKDTLAPVLSYQPFDSKNIPVPIRKVPEKSVVKPVSQKTGRLSQRQVPAKVGRPDSVTGEAQVGDIDTKKTLPPESPAPEKHVNATHTQALDSGILKLQAISWSNTPSQRVAVINNSVLGEKDRIEGYEILEINKDEIILSDSSLKKFRLVFKSR